MTQTPNLPPAGWYPDPAGGGGERFWDGQAWSQSTREARPEPSAPSQPYGQPQQGQWQPDPAHQSYQRQSPVPAQGNYRIAEFMPRVGGYLIDSVILYIVGSVLNLLFAGESQEIFQSYLERVMLASLQGTPTPAPPMEALTQMGLLSLMGLVVFAAYRAIMLGTKSATVGQMLFGLQVAKLGDQTNAPISWRDAIIRGAGGAVLYNFIPFFLQLTALVTSRKQTVPDLLSKTVVVNTREAIS